MQQKIAIVGNLIACARSCNREGLHADHSPNTPSRVSASRMFSAQVSSCAAAAERMRAVAVSGIVPSRNAHMGMTLLVQIR